MAGGLDLDNSQKFFPNQAIIKSHDLQSKLLLYLQWTFYPEC